MRKRRHLDQLQSLKLQSLKDYCTYSLAKKINTLPLLPLAKEPNPSDSRLLLPVQRPDTTPSLPQTTGDPDNEFSAVSAYLLGPGDELDLRVFGYDEYTGAQIILPDGTITLPIIGKVVAEKQTPEQLTQEITARLQTLLVEPIVTVRVSRLRPLLVNITGEVQRPGPIQLQGLSGAGTTTTTGGSVQSTGSIPTVSTAITSVGGITKNADIRTVVLKRLKPSGETVSITLNLWEAIRSANSTPDVLLRDGDTLFVPKATDSSELDPKLLSRSSLAPKTVRVTVFGEVKSPGEHQVAPDSNISKAVGVAGGPTKEANLAAVAYVRLNDNGTVQKQGLDLSNLSDNVQVQDGDVVIVPRTDVATFGDILQTASTILNPLLLFRILR
ncbi:MAG: polysaccharide export protein [Pseudanabaena sp. RU_4_16]|nr:polysaccharide export protein [Pseudanabaena sp. RU_4_16]